MRGQVIATQGLIGNLGALIPTLLFGVVVLSSLPARSRAWSSMPPSWWTSFASVLNAVEEVENALAGYNRDARAVDAQSRLVANASEAVDLTRTAYELGDAAFFPVLDAERTLLEARQQLANAVRQQALNFIALSVAASGGVGIANGS